MQFPNQETTQQKTIPNKSSSRQFDIRSKLNPRRLTIAMWDQAFLLRHQQGESFSDWDRVLDEAIERGFNTLRLDPMVESIDLDQPDQMLTWGALDYWPFLPWNWIRGITCPAGRWIIEFLHKAVERNLWVTFSSWWSHDESTPPGTVIPKNTLAGAELWVRFLRNLKREVGLDRVVYVDFANEMPYFFPYLQDQLNSIAPTRGLGSDYSSEQVNWLREQLDPPLAALQYEFPELRFTHSIHGDPRWFSVGLKHLDCLDVHFYSDADSRWTSRSGFEEFSREGALFRTDQDYSAFSQRCTMAYRSVGPMLLQFQRERMASFSAWSQSIGAPITCSEGWSSWFYIDHADLDWGWLLNWSEQAIENAIACEFWGVTPHNYCQPQFENWKDVRWHRRLNERFLAS